ncbi:Asp23/Gls24 family envelope stress response protein [Thermaerobacter sp. PB12/4term]|uniref:Asp23/Gls24 family envelope stress response protein n=1 Tax=Thermaerobacter sp. PB12/4term TaxID=2293838 RepID=UPI000E32C26B|nr:Asp23/Gls24 family envelope stress response protein [Thermaerobacter sp. PB12/4term]QIA28001.1 Asp23/Gls24 family envelope stress response protein [Thermaerobacter sp. PB12/4term]
MEVIALVGPSGTGKSHRAAAVAREVEADALIDDGLLIRESRIVAGVSAKREATKIGAIRRALFVDPAHRDEVRRALEALRPRRVLILGTSRDMVDRIAATLGLPAPARYIGIEEVATPAGIRRAQLIRRTQGRHVIPAPTFEVKRSFSGYLLDPLRLFYRGKNRPAGSGQVIEKTMVRPTYSSLGRFFITRQVVGSIAAYAAARVTGVAEVLRAGVTDREEGVAITLEVAVEPGRPLRAVLASAQRQALQAVEHMTALNVIALDVVARRLAGGGAGPAEGRGPAAGSTRGGSAQGVDPGEGGPSGAEGVGAAGVAGAGRQGAGGQGAGGQGAGTAAPPPATAAPLKESSGETAMMDP